ncbi:MAG: hypothetical protein M3R31_13730 [Pseudomonadota bacterium]|nr:hypothetical protein [Pseudomonadota bacterium]
MSIYAPFRFLVAAALALLIATVIASSTAHGVSLGNAVVQSTLGSPLRAEIPVATAPGELLQAGCFRVVPAGDGSAQTVTGQVSLERAASGFRLVVTTENAVTEPAIRFGIQAGCDTMSRRDYLVLLDPQVAGVPAAAAVQPTARKPGQERPVLPPAATGRNADRTPTASESRPARASTLAGNALLERERLAATGAAPSVFRPIGTGLRLPASAAETPVVQTEAPFAFFGGSRQAFWYLSAAIVVLCTIGFAVMIMRQRRAPPLIPQWTRGSSYAGPRSLANLSVQPATQPPRPKTLSPLSSTEARTAQDTPSDLNSKPVVSPTVAEGTAPRTRTNSIPPEVSAIDTLLNALDPDIVEERSIREAWAAARNDVERSAEKKETEAAGDAILQAIEDAERDLLFALPLSAQAEIDSSLDEELLHSPQRPRKAAA